MKFIYRKTLVGDPFARRGEIKKVHTGDMGVTTFLMPSDAPVDGGGGVGTAVPTRLMARLPTLPLVSFSRPPMSCSMAPNSTATPAPDVTLPPVLPSGVG